MKCYDGNHGLNSKNEQIKPISARQVLSVWSFLFLCQVFPCRYFIQFGDLSVLEVRNQKKLTVQIFIYHNSKRHHGDSQSDE